MCWNRNKIKKHLLFVTVLIVVTGILLTIEFLIKAYYNPIKKGIYLSTKGCLIYNLDESDYEIIEVEVVGETLDYLFNNKLPAIQGNVLINDYSIFTQKEAHYDPKSSFDYLNGLFFSEFHDKSKYASVETGSEESICKIVTVSKSWDILVCGIVIDENADDKVKQIIKKDAILVIPANNLEKAKEFIDEVALNSSQMNEWLQEHNWIKKGNKRLL